MIFRTLVFMILISLAVGIPLLATRGKELMGTFSKSAPATDGLVSGDDDRTVVRGTTSASQSDAQAAAAGELAGPPAAGLADILRFDVSPAWVYQRWTRKSTALAELDWHGIRVPLVTGTKPHDLAGSLTYYFDSSGAVQRISFVGRTGDTRPLVGLVTTRHGLRPQKAEIAGEQLYQNRWNGRPVSELRIHPASVIWASAAHAGFSVQLDLQRPGTTRYLRAEPTPPVAARPPVAEKH